MVTEGRKWGSYNSRIKSLPGRPHFTPIPSHRCEAFPSNTPLPILQDSHSATASSLAAVIFHPAKIKIIGHHFISTLSGERGGVFKYGGSIICWCMRALTVKAPGAEAIFDYCLIKGRVQQYFPTPKPPYMMYAYPEPL